VEITITLFLILHQIIIASITLISAIAELKKKQWYSALVCIILAAGAGVSAAWIVRAAEALY